jgi:hypothetical protein
MRHSPFHHPDPAARRRLLDGLRSDRFCLAREPRSKTLSLKVASPHLLGGSTPTRVIGFHSAHSICSRSRRNQFWAASFFAALPSGAARSLFRPSRGEMKTDPGCECRWERPTISGFTATRRASAADNGSLPRLTAPASSPSWGRFLAGFL